MVPVALFFLALRAPKAATLALLALLPAYLIRNSVGPIPTTLLELSIWAVALGTAWHSAKRRELLVLVREVNKTIQKSHLVAPVLLFVAAVTLGAALSVHLATSWGAWKAWLVDPLLVGVLILATFKSARDAGTATLVLASMSAALSLYGLWEYFFAHAGLEDGRLDSVFVPANYHAMLSVPILALSFGLIFQQETSRVMRILLGGFSGISVVALFFTFSYGGYVALGASVLFLLLAQKGNMRKWGVTLLAASIAVVLFSQIPSQKFVQLFDFQGRSSSHVREQIWSTTVLMIKEKPLTGIGFGDYEFHYRRLVPEVAFPPLEWLVAQPHNLYLALWSQTGILGLLLFVWLIIQFFKLGFSHRDPYSYALMSAMIAILVHGLVDTPYFKNDLAVLFWVLFAMITATQKSIDDASISS